MEMLKLLSMIIVKVQKLLKERRLRFYQVGHPDFSARKRMKMRKEIEMSKKLNIVMLDKLTLKTSHREKSQQGTKGDK